MQIALKIASQQCELSLNLLYCILILCFPSFYYPIYLFSEPYGSFFDVLSGFLKAHQRCSLQRFDVFL